MTPETIRIVCPSCRAVLRVKYQPGIETKRVLCPKCGVKSPFTAYGQPSPMPQQQRPAAPVPPPLPQAKPGRLVDAQTGMTYELHEGRNIIGRKAVTSGANVQLVPSGNVAMQSVSREHLVIDVTKGADGSYTHVLALFKPTVNETRLNGRMLVFGSSTKLNNYDSITLPGCVLRFMN